MQAVGFSSVGPSFGRSELWTDFPGHGEFADGVQAVQDAIEDGDGRLARRGLVGAKGRRGPDPGGTSRGNLKAPVPQDLSPRKADAAVLRVPRSSRRGFFPGTGTGRGSNGLLRFGAPLLFELFEEQAAAGAHGGSATAAVDAEKVQNGGCLQLRRGGYRAQP